MQTGIGRHPRPQTKTPTRGGRLYDRTTAGAVIPQALAVSITMTPALAKVTGKLLPVTVTSGVVLVKSVNKLLSLGVTVATVLQKRVNKNLILSITVTPVLAAIKVILKALEITVTVTPVLVKRIGKLLATGVTVSLSVSKRVGKILTANPVVSFVLDTVFIPGGVVIQKALEVVVSITPGLVTQRIKKIIAEMVVRRMGDNADPHRLGPATKFWFNRSRRK